MKDFRKQLIESQKEYKENILGVKNMGTWKCKPYPHILPEEVWGLNLWDDIRESAQYYFNDNQIAWHKEKHNLLSSQIMCINLFFPLKQYPKVLKPWLAKAYPDIQDVFGLNFEYTGPQNKNYFNEQGSAGQNRTSSDLSIEWEDKQGRKNLLLLEFKFTELAFGPCSNKDNLDRKLCFQPKKIVDLPKTYCYRAKIERAYWEFILSPDSPFRREALTTESYCPFLYGFYQLMRNQLLAYCIQSDSKSGFQKAEFGIMYHDENTALLRMSHPFGGERNPLKAWPTLLKNPDTFHVFTIQEFLNAIETSLPNELRGWRSYIKDRYRL
jgi:hypothetical protein